MRICPTCQAEYPDGTPVCAKDGAVLEERVVAGTAPTMASDGGAAVALEARPSEPRPLETFDPLIGSTLAQRYQIVRRIGEGGMGAVYEARHVLIGKRVAVKVLLEKFHAKTDFVARLLQEARLASSIGHENIVDVTDFGTTDDGRSFVVMEFLEGESLAQLVMREAPLPVARSLRIARQVASALGATHAKGIFHRDVKPENVYLVRRGDADFVKVVDFGISKATKPGDDGADAYRLTHTGLLLGTPLYMSPEQARGEENLDHRVDIWALGVMMYECLTGEVPFRANNYLGIISQVLTHEALPPSKLRPELGVPPAVESVVMRAMEKDRERRYQTIAELERDIERLLAGDQNVGMAERDAAEPGFREPSPPLSRRHRYYLTAAGALALSFGLAAALHRPQPVGRAEVAGAAHTGAPLPAAPQLPAAAAPPALPSPPLPATAPVPAAAPTAAPAAPTPVAAGAPGAESPARADEKPSRPSRKLRVRRALATAPSAHPTRAVSEPAGRVKAEVKVPLGSKEAYPSEPRNEP